ncbi:hypothetical protein [Erythrobacter sp. Alg231-14]|uniref:hypothetical protein n=1 Tax=Erythrobacter sp. Alg231-14 TaxID=1922225 RepID=UPI00307BBF39
MKDHPLPPVLLHSISEILLELAQSAGELGDALSENPQVLDGHLLQLQRLDVFGQTLFQLSAMLDQGPTDAIDTDGSNGSIEHAALKRLRSQLSAASPDIAA